MNSGKANEIKMTKHKKRTYEEMYGVEGAKRKKKAISTTMKKRIATDPTAAAHVKELSKLGQKAMAENREEVSSKMSKSNKVVSNRPDIRKKNSISKKKYWDSLTPERKEERVRGSVLKYKKVTRIIDSVSYTCRSKFEADFIDVLVKLKIEFQYESLIVPSIRFSKRYYPDFYLPNFNLILELKSRSWLKVWGTQEKIVGQLEDEILSVYKNNYEISFIWYEDFYANPEPSRLNWVRNIVERKVQRLCGEDSKPISRRIASDIS